MGADHAEILRRSPDRSPRPFAMCNTHCSGSATRLGRSTASRDREPSRRAAYQTEAGMARDRAVSRSLVERLRVDSTD